MKPKMIIVVAFLACWSLPAQARIGADMLISPTNSNVEGLSFEVNVEDTGRLQATVIVTWTKSDNFPTNIHASVELKDKDGFLGNVPFVGRIDGNKMTILATFDRRVFEYSDVIVSTVGRIYPVDTRTNQPTGSFIVAGRAYRVRVAEFMKK